MTYKNSFPISSNPIILIPFLNRYYVYFFFLGNLFLFSDAFTFFVLFVPLSVCLDLVVVAAICRSFVAFVSRIRFLFRSIFCVQLSTEKIKIKTKKKKRERARQIERLMW